MRVTGVMALLLAGSHWCRGVVARRHPRDGRLPRRRRAAGRLQRRQRDLRAVGAAVARLLQRHCHRQLRPGHRRRGDRVPDRQPAAHRQRQRHGADAHRDGQLLRRRQRTRAALRGRRPGAAGRSRSRPPSACSRHCRTRACSAATVDGSYGQEHPRRRQGVPVREPAARPPTASPTRRPSPRSACGAASTPAARAYHSTRPGGRPRSRPSPTGGSSSGMPVYGNRRLVHQGRRRHHRARVRQGRRRHQHPAVLHLHRLA